MNQIRRNPKAENPRAGQSTLELLIALAIFVMVMGAVIILVFGGQSLAVSGGEASRALALARENMEKSGATAVDNFPGLVSSSSIEDEFLKDISVENLDGYTKRVTSRVSWQSDPLRSENVTLIQVFTDWRQVKAAAGDTGGTGTSGDWRNPRTLGSVDLGPGVSATGLDVFQKIIYLAADAADSKKPDFFIVDASNGQAPSIVSSLNTGPGLAAVDTAGGYAYVAQESSSGQLQIINVANRASSSLAASFSLLGNSAEGKSLFYSGGKVYIGTLQSSGAEFHVVDVSNPASPSELGSFEVGADVNGIQVNGSYAYLATGDNSRELRILNVSNPAAITSAGSFDAAGQEDGKSLYLYGSTVYLGRVSSGDPDFYILDVASSTDVRTLGSKTLGADVNGMRIRDNLGFIGTSDSNKEFQVWDISSPASMVLWSSFNFPQVATGVDYEDNLVYVSVRSNDAVRIITSGP